MIRVHSVSWQSFTSKSIPLPYIDLDSISPPCSNCKGLDVAGSHQHTVNSHNMVWCSRLLWRKSVARHWWRSAVTVALASASAVNSLGQWGTITDGLCCLGVGCGLSYQGGMGWILWFGGVSSSPSSASALGEGQRSLGQVAHCNCHKGENATIGVVLDGYWCNG
jgi:hypothetical protein